MRLLDQVSQALGDLLVALPDGATAALPGPAQVAAAVAAAPLRYVLDGSVAEFAASFAIRETERLLACLDLVRAPAPSLSIEWEDAERAPVLRQAGFGASQVRRRAGMLIESEPGGRSGSVQVLWVDAETGDVDLSPMIIEFDLDDPALSRRQPDPGEIAYGATFEAGGQVAGRDALEALFARTRFRIRPEWRTFYQRQRLGWRLEEESMRTNCECVAAEFPFALGFFLALAARNAVSLTAVELDRLNRARGRRGKAALLDYTEVSAWLGGRELAAGARGDSVRAQTRLHFVSGHLVRRGGHIFWRRAHLRGDPKCGIILTRTIRLQMAGGEPSQVAALA